MSLWVSDSNLLPPNIGVSLALSSSYNYLILVLTTVSSAQGFKTITVSLSKVLEGPVADLLAIVFYGMVIGVLGNSG